MGAILLHLISPPAKVVICYFVSSGMSVIFYKFKSAKDYDKLIFDGSSVSVFELKREIILSKDFGGGADFDLVVYNAQSLEGRFYAVTGFPVVSSVLLLCVVRARDPWGSLRGFSLRRFDRAVDRFLLGVGVV